MCNCEAEKSFITHYFDFCAECIFEKGKCKGCRTAPVLSQLTQLRLKTELVISSAEITLKDAEELREMINKNQLIHRLCL